MFTQCPPCFDFLFVLKTLHTLCSYSVRVVYDYLNFPVFWLSQCTLRWQLVISTTFIWLWTIVESSLLQKLTRTFMWVSLYSCMKATFWQPGSNNFYLVHRIYIRIYLYVNNQLIDLPITHTHWTHNSVSLTGFVW